MATISQSPSYPDTQIGMWDSVKKGVRQSGIPWLFVLPSVMVMLFITFYPQIYQVWIAFHDFQAQNLSGQVAAPLVWFDNFRNILTSQLTIPNYRFLPLLGFNILWTLINVFFHVAFGLAVAVALNGQRVLFRRFYRAIFVLPWALPGYITALIWNNLWQENSGGFNLLFRSINNTFGTSLPTRTAWLTTLDRPIDLRAIIPYIVAIASAAIVIWLIFYLRRNGLRDKLTGKLSVDKTVFGLGGLILLTLIAIATFADIFGGRVSESTASLFFERAGAPVMAFYSVLIANIWLGWPFMMVVATGALTSIPPDMYEAADVDGASKVRQFFRLTLPLLRPAIAVALVFRTLDAVRVFDVFNVLFSDARQSMATYNYTTLVNGQQAGYASAVGVVIFLIILIFTVLYVRILGVNAE
jgi:ABC-type sugar transport system permease subunit